MKKEVNEKKFYRAKKARIIAFIFLIMILFTISSKATNSEDIRNGMQIEDNLLQDKQLASYAGISSYDSRKYYDTLVFDQTQTNTCWANSGLMALTISMDSSNRGRYIFSRRHAALTINGTLQEGGWFDYLADYIISGRGPILEVDIPWRNISDDDEANNKITEEEEEKFDELKPTKKVNSYERFPAIYKRVDENGNVICYHRIKKTSKEIKKTKKELERMEEIINEKYRIMLQWGSLYEDAEKEYEELQKKYEEFINGIQEGMDGEKFEEEENKILQELEKVNEKKKTIETKLKEADREYQTKQYEYGGLLYNEKILTDEEIENERNQIKRAIVRYGAVDVSINGAHALTNISTGFLNQDIVFANGHAVIAIGWDDNYAVENFKGAFKPKKPGAYLIQNSWGKSRENPEGTFWVSYEDIWIEQAVSVWKDIVDVDYDNIYQYDDMAGVGRNAS